MQKKNGNINLLHFDHNTFGLKRKKFQVKELFQVIFLKLYREDKNLGHIIKTF